MSDKIANIKWAQRKNLILLKIDVNGATSEDIQLTADNLSISVTAPSGEIFKFKTDLFAEAVPEVKKKSNNIHMLTFPISLFKLKLILDTSAFHSKRKMKKLISGHGSPK